MVYLVKRLFTIIIMLFGLLVITFIIANVAPGDPARLIAGPNADEEMVKVISVEYGLDKPLYQQFYRYVGGVLHGDFGKSLRTARPVLEDIKRYLPATFELVVYAMMLAILVGLPIGVLSAVFQNRAIDHIARFLSISGMAMPLFWLGMILQYVLSLQYDLFPLGSRLDMLDDPPQMVTSLYTFDFLIAGNPAMSLKALWHITLPAVALSIPTLAAIIRITRAEMLEVLSQDYIATAKAMGIHPFRIITLYAARNAMLPILATVGLHFGWMLGGTVLIESVYDFPGIGLYAVQSVVSSDFQPIMGVTLILGGMFMLINLAIDLAYSWLDPRVKGQI